MSKAGVIAADRNAAAGAITILAFLASACVPGNVAVDLPHTPSQRESSIASKKTKDFVVSITSPNGELGSGDNDLCVLFQKRGAQGVVEVQKVSVDFVLLAGRIQEKPLSTQLTERQPGQYCASVNLGQKVYFPAFYYVFVRYIDPAYQKKKKIRFFVAVG